MQCVIRPPLSVAGAPVWVLDDPRAGTSAQALGIAERLEVPFRRIPLTWNWMSHVAALARRGSLIGVAHYNVGMDLAILVVLCAAMMGLGSYLFSKIQL